MREIKFRMWNISKNAMELQSDDRAVSLLGKPMECVGSNDSGEQWDLMCNVVLMQYTGLKDKNGKEIYEGDLIRNESGRICLVEWHNESACWDASPDYTRETSGDCYGFNTSGWKSAVEIIGNIYKNPELIK